MVASHSQYRSQIYSDYLSQVMPQWRDLADEHYLRWAHAYRARLRGWLPADRDERCLDLGCGPGNVLFLLRGFGYQQVEGVDLSAECVRQARRFSPAVTQSGAAEYLRGAAPGYRLITAFDLLEHLGKDELLDLLQAVYAALAPGGVFIAQVPNAASPWGLQVRYGDLTHELAFDPAGLRKIFQMAGFAGFEARECGPAPGSAAGVVRWAAWQVLRGLLVLWNLVETGATGGSTYTRIFLAKVVKPL